MEEKKVLSQQSVLTMNLEELGEQVLEVGRKHKGEKYVEIYEDDSYNNWVAGHVSEDPKHSPGLSGYATYLRRRLQAELEMDHKTTAGSDRRQSPPMTMKKEKETAPKEPKGYRVPPEMALPVTPFEEDEEVMSQWSKVEVMEGEMEGLHLRMGQMENVLSQILNHLQSNQAAGSQQPVVKREG